MLKHNQLRLSQYKECASNISDIAVYNTSTYFKFFNGFRYQHRTLHQSLEFQKFTQKPHQIAALSNFDCRFFSPDIKV